jgi:hypothetical protein
MFVHKFRIRTPEQLHEDGRAWDQISQKEKDFLEEEYRKSDELLSQMISRIKGTTNART